MTDNTVQQREQHFAALKAKYQASDYEDTSPSSPLYFILRKADLGIELTEFELAWLTNHALFQTSERLSLQPEKELEPSTEEFQQLAVELSPLVSKYKAKAQPFLTEPSNPIYFIVWHLDSEGQITDSELQWLKQHQRMKTATIANQMNQFVTLKAKYQAADYSDSSPSSPLYSILKLMENEKPLTDQQLNWLESNGLFQTRAIVQQQESARQEEFAKLKEKYQATEYPDSSVTGKLYHILRKLEAENPLLGSEWDWLTEQKLTETLNIALEIKHKRHFMELKRRYLIAQDEEPSPSNPLYPILINIDSGKLTPSDMTFLSTSNQTEIIALAVDKYSANLKKLAKSGKSFSPEEVDWLQLNGREDIITSAKDKQLALLKTKYGIPNSQEKSHSSPLYEILQTLERNERLEPTQVAWLTNKRLFHYGSQIFIAYHKREAKNYEQEYKQTGNKWSLASASSHWRSAKEPRQALRLTDELSFNNIKEKKLKLALLTTRGGAFRDLGQFNEAKQCARKAIQSQQSRRHPYTLMGALCYEQGEYEEGERWFNEAVKRGASPKDKDAEIERVVKKAHKDKLEQVVAYLLKRDPVQYEWATKYLVDKR